MDIYVMLLKMMGHTANATDTTIKLSQDDATNEYIIHVGNKRYHGKSLNEAIDHAYTDTIIRS